MGRLNPPHELSRLCTIGMSGKADLLDREIYGDLLIGVFHAGDVVSLFEIAGDAALRAIASDADPILGIMAPSFEEGSRLPVLEHARRAHDHHGVVLFGVDAGVLLEVVDVPVLEGVRLSGEWFTSYL